MFKCCKFSLQDSKDSRYLNYEDDQNPAVACTSTIQRWHQKGGGQNIVPHPVMEVEVTKTRLDNHRQRGGVKCLLYEARKNSETSQQEIDSFLRYLKTYDSSMGLSQISTGKSNQVTDSKFGPCQLGLYLFYQISYTESNFKVIADLSAVQRKAISADAVYQFPQFPLNSQEPLDPPDCFTEEEWLNLWILHQSTTNM